MELYDKSVSAYIVAFKFINVRGCACIKDACWYAHVKDVHVQNQQNL